MKPKNKYITHTHISERKFREILRYFCADETASKTSHYTRVGRKTINRIFNLLRKRILELTIEDDQQISGEIELDESYFGPKRIRGKRGRGASHKIPVFGLLKRKGKVYVSIVKNCSKEQLIPIIKRKILEGSTLYTDGWKSYDGLILNGYKHYRIYHSKDEFARGKNHVNGIESFWSYTKRRLNKFNGIKKERFPIFLKESQWRFNNRHDDIYMLLLKELKDNPL